jgi:hypothetical protein
MLLSDSFEPDVSHTTILYYCIKWMYFLRYNDF